MKLLIFGTQYDTVEFDSAVKTQRGDYYDIELFKDGQPVLKYQYIPAADIDYYVLEGGEFSVNKSVEDRNQFIDGLMEGLGY